MAKFILLMIALVAVIAKKNAEISISVDKAIIGGIKLKIENTFLDASIQNQLQMLKNKLLLS